MTVLIVSARSGPSTSTSSVFLTASSSASWRCVPLHVSTVDALPDSDVQLQEKKRALTTATLSGDKLKNSRLGIDDLVALFRGHDVDEEEEE